MSLRKLIHFARRTKPQRASQMSQCLGAGTGCGWCIPFLIKIATDPDRFEVEEMTAEEYAAARKAYIDNHQPRNQFDSPDASCS